MFRMLPSNHVDCCLQLLGSLPCHYLLLTDRLHENVASFCVKGSQCMDASGKYEPCCYQASENAQLVQSRVPGLAR